MAETDAEDRAEVGGRADQIERDARAIRVAGARRDHDGAGAQRKHLGHGHGVVAPHLDVGPQLAQIMVQVVGEAVVVIEQKQHHEDDISSAGLLALGRASLGREKVRPVSKARRGLRRQGESAIAQPSPGLSVG